MQQNVNTEHLIQLYCLYPGFAGSLLTHLSLETRIPLLINSTSELEQTV